MGLHAKDKWEHLVLLLCRLCGPVIHKIGRLSSWAIELHRVCKLRMMHGPEILPTHTYIHNIKPFLFLYLKICINFTKLIFSREEMVVSISGIVTIIF